MFRLLITLSTVNPTMHKRKIMLEIAKTIQPILAYLLFLIVKIMDEIRLIKDATIIIIAKMNIKKLPMA